MEDGEPPSLRGAATAKVQQLRLSATDFEKRVRALAKDSKNVRWRSNHYETHAEERQESRGIDHFMMFEVLRTGHVKGEIRPGKYEGEWIGKMVKKMKGHRDVGVVTVLIRNNRLKVATTEWED